MTIRMMRWRWRGPTAVCASGAVGALLVLAFPTSAAASCAASPVASPHRFVGMVMDVSDGGRVAQVAPAGGGPMVEVDGSPAHGANSATSVDRTYLRYATYEFDPVNATAPYQDNICTATRLIAGPKATGAVTEPATAAHGTSWWWIGGGAGGATVAGAGLVVGLRRRGAARSTGGA